MNETEKENVKEAEEEEEGIWVREQRKRSKRRRRREEQLTDRLDLALASDGGQRQWAEVRGQTSVIFLFFFFRCWLLEPRRSHSKPCRRSKKKKTLTGHWNQASRTCTGVRHVSDAQNGVSVQPS